MPVIIQMEALECGAACLAMILAYYGKWLPLEVVRHDCGVSRDGSKAINIIKAARNYGLDAHGYRLEPKDLKESAVFPCIIHWNMNHFVVLDGFRGDKAIINDPGRGRCSVDMKQLDESFTGICLTFEPNEGFVPEGRQKSVLSFAKEKLEGEKTALIFTVLSTVIASVFGIINPAFSRVFLDRLLTRQSPSWFLPFIYLLSAFSILQIVMNFVREIYSNRLNAKIDGVGNATYMWKLLHLPLNFFAQRLSGDIFSRKNANANVAKVLVRTLAPLVIDTAMMVFYLAVMIRYSLVLTLIGVVSILINAVVAGLTSKKRLNIARVLMRDSGKLSSTTVSGIGIIETIKASGAENGFFEKWSGYQASVNGKKVELIKVNTGLGLIPQIVSSLSTTAVLVLGVYLTIQGKFTAGMLLAFQGFLSAFLSPASQIISVGQSLQEMRADMERIDDVMKYPDDVVFSNDSADENATHEKLLGNIEIKNLTFGYSRLGEPVIRDFNLSVKRGECVALVGASGCGKSTVSKLISGLYMPWEGEILFDGKKMSEICRNDFTGSVAVVDQDIVLFEDTIKNNIKMWDNSIEDFVMILSANDAQIHDDIMDRVGGYNHKLLEGGKNFSGGQRQRLEIARVLTGEPSIVILDEATSALDAKTESEVVNAIRTRRITCIIIAHRLSTIRDCDEIVVLDKGVTVERGTHSELMAKNGAYSKLVSNE